MLQQKIVIIFFLLIFQKIKTGISEVIVSTSDSTLLNGFSLTEYISQNGYPIEIHKNIQTEDDYLLTLHRIPPPLLTNTTTQIHRPAVLLMHGMEGSAPNWIIMGPKKSLAFILADQGYDVWMGNARGTTYSKTHVNLNPKKDAKYWDFSWHEIGYYDLPAIIQYIVNKTNDSQIMYVGHSQGTTSFFVMTSTRPEMNAMVKLMVALAPGVFYMPIQMPLKGITGGNGYGYLEYVRQLLQLNQMSTEISCAQSNPLTSLICDVIIKTITRSNLNPENLERVKLTFPDSCSIRQVLHYIQLFVSGEFGQYDFGKQLNMKKYGQSEAPQYDLTKTTVPVALLMGKYDFMGLPINVKRMQNKIQNVVLYYVVPDPGFNHFNFIIDENVDELINKKVVDLLEQYGGQ